MEKHTDKMRTNTKWIWIVALLMAAPIAEAQLVSPVDFMRLNPYQTNRNVATELPYDCYFSPGIGNFAMDMQYSHLGIRDLFKMRSFDLKSLLDVMEDENGFSIDLNHNLQSFGIRVGDGILSLNHNYRVRGNASFNYCLFKLLAYGNMAFLGEDNPATVYLDLDTQAFHEYALGYQLNVVDRLSLGIRAKLLFGIADLSTDAFGMMLYTDPESYALYVQEDIGLRFSLPRKFQLEDGSLTAQGPFGLSDFYHNRGFGFDLAVGFHINDRFSMTMAVNDLGHIRWYENNMEISGVISDDGQYCEEGTLVFQGFDADKFKQFFSDKAYRKAVMDTLNECFDLHTSVIGDYTTKLPTNFLLRGSFDLNEQNRFVAQFQGCFTGNGFRPAMTLAYNGCFFDKIDLCGTYTITKGSLANLGFGLGFKFGAFQMYAASSNWLNLSIGGTTVRNYQAGIVFSLGQAEKRGFGGRSPIYMD